MPGLISDEYRDGLFFLLKVFVLGLAAFAVVALSAHLGLHFLARLVGWFIVALMVVFFYGMGRLFYLIVTGRG